MLGFAGLLREWEQGLSRDFVRGELVNEASPDSETLTFQFNPTQVQYRRSVSFQCGTATQKSDTGSGNSLKFQSPTNVSFTLMLDDTTRPLSLFGSADSSVLGDHLRMLTSWTDVGDATDTAPPTLVFRWGKLTIGSQDAFRCKLTNLTVKVTRFNPDGSPMRATASVRLQGVETTEGQTKKPQNPTSRVERVTRRHALRSGQTLQNVAFEAFGTPGAWRRIAELNGIDDPTRLPAGTELLLPDGIGA